ncbi:MAG: hypothetical protein ACOCV4_07490, partial [Myxococcota bacterium]
MATAERLAEVDAELSALGKGDDEVQAVRERVASGGAGSLDDVDGQLETLAADLQGAQELLARASAHVPAVKGTFAKGAAAPPPPRSAPPPPPPASSRPPRRST